MLINETTDSLMCNPVIITKNMYNADMYRTCVSDDECFHH